MNEEKLNSELDLNFIQSIAIKGEITSILQNCRNAVETECATFLLINYAVPEHYTYYNNVIKEHVDEEIVDKYFVYKSAYQVPYDLWINKVKSDLCTMRCANGEVHKDVKRSKFVAFVRAVLCINDYAVGLLIKNFLEDEEMEYLHDILMYFSEVLADEENRTWDTYEELVKITMDEAVKRGIEKKEEISEDKYRYLVALALFKVGINNIDVLDIREEIAKENKDKQQESLKQEYEAPQTQNAFTTRSMFVVKKVLKEGKRVVSEKSFYSEPEAIKYREAILSDYPELTNQFEFVIEEKR